MRMVRRPNRGVGAAERGRWFGVGVTVAALAIVSGCELGPKNFLNDNDSLRRQAIELDARIEQLEQDLAMKSAQIRRMAELSEHKPTMLGVTWQDLPRLDSVRVGRYSGVTDTNGDGIGDTLRLYVHTRDQQGRFLPVLGQAVVQLVVIEPGEAPRQLVEQTYSPLEFDRAYRSGFTGTHYTLDVLLGNETGVNVGATAKLTFTDAGSGAVLTHEIPVIFEPGP